jgi:CRP-like cAMP-binding protein
MSSEPVAALGQGGIFGELALIDDKPRSAAVSCWTDCEFLIIEKDDFNRILKAEVKHAKEAKLEFMRSFVPGSRKLPQDSLERIMYYFGKESYPRNHCFFEQGEAMTGSIYFVWQGSVETYCIDPDTGGLMRLGILMKGSLFAAVPQGGEAQYSAVAMSADCEVLRVKPENKRQLPDVIVLGLRELLDAMVARRSAECTPLSPMGSAFEPRPQSNYGNNNSSPIRARRTEKVPRPLSGKMPVGGIRQRPGSVGGSVGSLAMRKTCSLPCFSGLFRRVVTEVDYETFNLEPGETLAMSAKKPRRREKEKRVAQEDRVSTPDTKLLESSMSLPSLGGSRSTMSLPA